MSRAPRTVGIASARDRLKLDFSRSALLRELYPQLSEVHIELSFNDQVAPAPSAQAFSYFPGARGFFRYSCPCHSCSGEFDLTSFVVDLAAKQAGRQHTRRGSVQCTGDRTIDRAGRVKCAIGVDVMVSAIVRSKEKT